MTRPLLLVSCALALGTLAGGGLPWSAALVLLVLAATLLGLCLAASGPRAATAGLLAAAAALGAADSAVERLAYDRCPLRAWVEHQPAGDIPARLQGRVVRTEPEEDRWRLIVDVETMGPEGGERAARGRAQIEVGGESARPAVLEGDRVALWATMRSARGYGDPGVFDRAEQARRDGIHALGHVKSPLLMKVEHRAGEGGWVAAAAAAARRACRRAIERVVLPGPERGLVRAMVLGDRSGVDEDTAEDFRAAGTYHVLALSGAQVALLAGVLLVLLRRLGLGPLPVALLVSAALVFYAAFVGAEVPIARAAVMGIVLLLGRSLDLDADMANLLGLAGGALLVHRPSALADVAFQLSFGATLGLVLLTPRLLRGWPRLPLGIERVVAASIAAQAAVAPLLLVHFHRLAPAALLLNLLAVPLAGAVMLLGIAAALSSAVWTAAGCLVGDLAWMSAHALLLSGRVMRLVPALDIRLPTPPAWPVAVYLGGLVAWAGAVRFRWTAALLAAGSAGLLFAAHPVATGRLELTVLDVGQGDCLIVRSPHGRFWLVDTGGSYDSRFDVGEAVVAPYLWDQGVRRLEGLVLTHADHDHSGGARFLLRTFAVGEVWEGVAPTFDRGYDALARSLHAWPGRRTSVGRGVRGEWDGVRVEVLGPAGGRPPLRTRNDDSVVLALRWGEVSLLLPGDIEAPAEAALGPVPAQVVKVPHHGSRSSSTAGWVAGVSPLLAVVSVGAGNRFGHPSPDVLRRYRARGARVFRTDLDGAVTVSTDGRHLWVRTFRGGGEERLR